MMRNDEIAALDIENPKIMKKDQEYHRNEYDMNDVRWKLRYNNFKRALQTLRRAVELSGQRDLSELEKQGLIQSFEYTHELAWNVLKDYLEEQGFVDIIGSKNATQEAFRNGLIIDGDSWMDMIKARNLTSHTYNTDIAESIVKDILARFYPAFAEMERRFNQLYGQEANEV